MTQNASELLEELRISHQRLAGLMNGPSAPPAGGSAYPEDWAVADVLSHLGSGAEIFTLILDRSENGEAAPSQEDFVAIWDRWNATSPDDQVHDGLRSDAAFVDRAFAVKSETERVPAFGSPMSIADFLAMRLQEHVVHTWDVEVATDRAATIPATHLPFLLERLPSVAPRSAREVDVPRSVHVRVESPDASFRVDLDRETTLLRDDESSEAELTMSAEGFVRLVFGRLPDPSAVVESEEQADLAADLARVFVGY
jgi:uncharacterized protein (TIGR03083 family)